MPRIPKNRKTRRLTLDLSIPIRKELEWLREVTQADTYVEVIRRAITVYAFVWRAMKGNGKLILRDDEGDHLIMLV